MPYKPTLFVDVAGGDQRNPVALALGQVGELFQVEKVDRLVGENDTEADIAVTDSVATALRMTKETESTTILLAYGFGGGHQQAVAFAGRYPDRVKAVSYIGGEGHVALVPAFLELVVQKAEGKTDEDSVS